MKPQKNFYIGKYNKYMVSNSKESPQSMLGVLPDSQFHLLVTQLFMV